MSDPYFQQMFADRIGGAQYGKSTAIYKFEKIKRAKRQALAEHPDPGERIGERGIAVRELWVHRIEEYARHCGHADLLRECIDGRTGL